MRKRTPGKIHLVSSKGGSPRNGLERIQKPGDKGNKCNLR